MMKRLYLLVPVLLVLCVFSFPALAQTEGDFAYSISGGEAKITAYTGSDAELILPDTLGGYPVTAINYCAFRNCTSLTRVVIPDGVTAIGSNAFQNCFALEQLEIPDSVTRIDTHAFYGCAALRQLVLHDSISKINILAFYGCSAVRYCRPDTLTAYALTDAGYSFNSPDYPLLTLKVYKDDNGLQTFTVADCDEAAACVSFPDGVTAIDRNAFYNCAALTEIAIPAGVAEIASSTFGNCASLRQITLPGSITRIADDAFSGCSDVTMISPDGSAGQAFALANAASGFTWKAL